MSKFFGLSIKSTHEHRLERWLGAEAVKQISENAKGWYGPPIAVQGVPGAVYVDGTGNFLGPIKTGQFAAGYDLAMDVAKRQTNEARAKVRRQMYKMGKATRQGGMAGFSSLSDIIAEAVQSGKKRDIFLQKTGTTGVIATASSLYHLPAQPAVGVLPSAAPGGNAPTGATLGCQYGLDNVSTDTRHYVSGWATANVVSNTLMMYDRIFHVLKTMSSAATESVTGVPTRYQSSTVTAADYAGGSFCFVEVGPTTAIAATAHNWTVCRYRNQANADTISFPSMVGKAGATSTLVNNLDHPLGSWFMPLAAGDTGVKDLDQMQCSASITGQVFFVVGHVLAILPCPILAMACKDDGIATAFNLTRVFDDAAIAFLEMPKPTATLTAYSAGITLVHG